MKRTIQAWVQAQGCITRYSGRTRTMYIYGPKAEGVELRLVKAFKDLPFATQSTSRALWPVIPKSN